jgi:ABC-2 type transport system permease protein
MIGRSAATFGDALFGMTTVLAILFPLLNLHISLVGLLRAVPLILITVGSSSTLGWLMGTISLHTRWGLLISNLAAYTMMILAGVNFPLTEFPLPVQLFSRGLPMTHGLLAIRAVIDGAAYSDILGLAGTEIVCGLAYGAMAWLFFAYQLRRAREMGSLELI